MQNKPNFPRFCAKNEDFVQKQTQFKPNSKPIKANSKPKQTQFKANFRKAKMNVSSVKTKDYEKNDIFSVPQNKANSNPIKPNFKPPPKSDSTILIFNFLFSFYGLSHSPSSVKKSLKRLTVKQLWAGRTIKTSPILILSKYLLSTFTTPCA